MSIALITDSHFGLYNFNKTKFYRMMDYFDNVFFPYVLENNIKDVIHCGDLVHNRVVMDNYIDGQIKKRFFKWFVKNKVNLHCIVGNHDTYYKNDIEHNWTRANSMEFLPYIKVYDKSTIIKIGNYTLGLVPWLPDIDMIKTIPSKDEVDILLGHFEVDGAMITISQTSKKGFSYDWFNGYKQVLSGHFHIKSTHNNFRYLGTQYQMSWGDYGDSKGFWTIEDNFVLSFHENIFSPRFLKLYYMETDRKITLKLGGMTNELQDISIEQARKYSENNYIRFIIKKFDSQELMEKTYNSIVNNSLDKIEIYNDSHLVENFNFEEFEETVKDDVEIITIIENFIKGITLKDGLDESKLVRLANSIYKQSNFLGEIS